MKVKRKFTLEAIAAGTAASLEKATDKAPEDMGCYIMTIDNEVVYVGKAESGLKKRFQSYYNGNNNYPSGRLIYNNRDYIFVYWEVLETKDECRTLETKLIKELDPSWNERSGPSQ
jgi:excinuclease UvrABC nuclease subunit